MTRLNADQLKTYDQLCNKVGKLLAKSSTLIPETRNPRDNESQGLRRKITDDSVSRFIDANIKNKRDTAVDNVLTQAFETLYQRRAHAQEIELPRGAVKVLPADVDALVATLKQFGRANSIGDTAKRIWAAQDDIRAFKLTGLKSDTQFAKKIDKVLDMMLVRYNPGGGYQSLSDIRDSNTSRTNKNAMEAAFKFLAHALGVVPHNATDRDYNNARICVDQRAQSHAMLQKLQDAESATMRAIMRVRV